jgi:hypothetical protein
MHTHLAHVAPAAFAGLPILNVLYAALASYVLIGSGFAILRCLPKRHTS